MLIFSISFQFNVCTDEVSTKWLPLRRENRRKFPNNIVLMFILWILTKNCAQVQTNEIFSLPSFLEVKIYLEG